MSTPGLIVAVAGMWWVAVATPGPDTLLIARVAVSRNRRQRLATVAGIGVGHTLWALSGYFGVQAMFELAPWLYEALMLAGAAYLILMGMRVIAGSFRPAETARPARSGPAFRLGLLTALANPKAALFVASLFAALMPVGTPVAVGLLAVAEMVAISVGWYMLVSWLLAAGPVASAYARAAHWVDRVAGAIFVGFGIRLIVGRVLAERA